MQYTGKSRLCFKHGWGQLLNDVINNSFVRIEPHAETQPSIRKMLVLQRGRQQLFCWVKARNGPIGLIAIDYVLTPNFSTRARSMDYVDWPRPFQVLTHQQMESARP